MFLRSGAVSLIVLALGCSRLLGADELSFDGAGGCSGDAPDASCEGGAGGDAPQACTSYRDCTPYAWNEPKLCIDRQCVPLKDGLGCDTVFGQENLWSDTPPFVFGIMAEFQSIRGVQKATFDLAVSEFSRGELEIGGKRVLPVAVACEVSTSDAAALKQSVDHLVDTLRVPAIVSSMRREWLTTAFEHAHAIKGKDVFFLSTFESNSRLTTIDDDGLLWHMRPSELDIARPYPSLVRRVEAYVNPTPEEGERRPTRLALIESVDPVHAEVAAYLDESLTFNGKFTRENAPENYLRILHDPKRVAFTEVLQRLTEFDPDVIVASVGFEFVDGTMAPLEALRPAGKRGPFYVVGPQIFAFRNIWDVVQGVPGLAARVVGVMTSTAREPQLSDAFLSKLWSATPPMDGRGAQDSYDAIYFTLYAAAAAGRVPEITGSLIARGMLQLIDGPRFDVGVTDMPRVMPYLQNGLGRIALHGTSGPPTFDPGTGARSGPGSVWCIGLTDGNPGLRWDALQHDPATDTLYGDFPCFEGF